MLKFNFKLSLLLIFVVPALILAGGFLSSSKAKASEKILLFDSNIELQQDRSAVITETIIHENTSPHHGIERYIPKKFKVNGVSYDIRVKPIEVYYYKVDDTSDLESLVGTDPTATTYGMYKFSRRSKDYYFRIGDPDQLISGDYKYVIKYSVQNAIGFYDDHDEFYWNITGNDWNMPILESSFLISSPFKVEDSLCYTGSYTSTQSNCTITKVDENTVKGKTTQLLSNYEGLTTATAYPPNSFEKPSQLEILFYKFLPYIGFLLIIPAWFIIHLIWIKVGKDPKVGTIIPEFDPPEGINPLIAGYILDQRTDSTHISAHLIYLAIKGYIRIETTQKEGFIKKSTEYSFVDLTKNRVVNMQDYETDLFEGVFDGADFATTNDMKKTFYKKIKSISDKIKKKAISDKYITNLGGTLKLWMSIIGGTIIGLTVFGPLLPVFEFNFSLGGFIVITGIILLIYSFFMQKRTLKGNKIYTDLLGLKQYIDTAEKDRIAFHNDPKKGVEIFEKLLPYAMIFKLEKKWAKEFENIYQVPPTWYAGDMRSFNTVYLVSSINSSVNATVSSAYAATRSSGGSGFGGGGFSGGGGGGGGGGSW